MVQFLNENLSIQVSVDDIDCAHRLGAVKNGTQTMLTRFFQRDIADHIMKCKKMLKGKPLVVHEDATLLNRQLINDLNKRPKVESVWTVGGKIWIKLSATQKKMKITINDNLNYKLRTAPTADDFVETRNAGQIQSLATATSILNPATTTQAPTSAPTSTPIIVVAGSSTSTAQNSQQFTAASILQRTAHLAAQLSTHSTMSSTTQVTSPAQATVHAAEQIASTPPKGLSPAAMSIPSPPYTATATEMLLIQNIIV